MAETKRHLRGQTLSPSESIELPRDAAPVATLARPARDRIERLADPDAKEGPFEKIPLWLVIEEIMSDVSDEEMAQVPPANSRTIDQKLYGKKTRETRGTK